MLKQAIVEKLIRDYMRKNKYPQTIEVLEFLPLEQLEEIEFYESYYSDKVDRVERVYHAYIKVMVTYSGEDPDTFEEFDTDDMIDFIVTEIGVDKKTNPDSNDNTGEVWSNELVDTPFVFEDQTYSDQTGVLVFDLSFIWQVDRNEYDMFDKYGI